MLLSLFTPPSLSPTVSTSLLSKSAYLFLPSKWAHLYQFSRFHIYTLKTIVVLKEKNYCLKFEEMCPFTNLWCSSSSQWLLGRICCYEALCYAILPGDFHTSSEIEHHDSPYAVGRLGLNKVAKIIQDSSVELWRLEFKAGSAWLQSWELKSHVAWNMAPYLKSLLERLVICVSCHCLCCLPLLLV